MPRGQRDATLYGERRMNAATPNVAVSVRARGFNMSKAIKATFDGRGIPESGAWPQRLLPIATLPSNDGFVL